VRGRAAGAAVRAGGNFVTETGGLLTGGVAVSALGGVPTVMMSGGGIAGAGCAASAVAVGRGAIASVVARDCE
jgi:hypothetical protein